MPQAFKSDPVRHAESVVDFADNGSSPVLNELRTHSRGQNGSPAQPGLSSTQAAATAQPGVDIILPAPLANIVEDLVIDDDRNFIKEAILILIIEDDITFARILLDLAHERGLKALVALRGATALQLARQFKPAPSRSISTFPTWRAGRFSIA